MSYTLTDIANELKQTAQGGKYYGNALYVANDIPSLNAKERAVIHRYLNDIQTDDDTQELNRIANKLLTQEDKYNIDEDIELAISLYEIGHSIENILQIIHDKRNQI
jgi:Na+/phosphate symporter